MKITTKHTALISVIAIILLALAISSAAMISQTSLGIQEKTTVATSNPTTNGITVNNPSTTIPTTSNIHTTTTTEKKEAITVAGAISSKTSLGFFRITVYCPSSDNGKWGYSTSTGVKSSHLRTCAVDPSVIPLGSAINVGGLVLNAVDTGSAVKGSVIDIFYDGTIDEAESWIRSFGTKHEVFIIEQSEDKN